MFVAPALLTALTLSTPLPPQPVLTLGAPARFSAEAPVEDLSFSPDGSALAALVGLGSRGAVDVYDVATGARRFRVGELPIGARGRVVFTPRGDRVVALTYGVVNVWDASTGARLRSFKLPRGWRKSVLRAAASSEGRWALLVPFHGSKSGLIELSTGEVRAIPHRETVMGFDAADRVVVRLSPRSSLLLDPATGNTVRRCNVAVDLSAREACAASVWPALEEDRQRGWRVVSFAASGRFAAASNKDGSRVHVWDRSRRSPQQVVTPGGLVSGGVWAIDVSHDGRLLALAGRGRLRVMSLPDRRWITDTNDVDIPRHVGISGCGRLIAVGDVRRGVRVFSTQGGGLLAEFPDQRNVHWLALGATGREVLVHDGLRATLFDVASGRQLWRITEGSVDRVAVSGDRSTIAIGGSSARATTFELMAWTRSRPTPWVRHTVAGEKGWLLGLTLSRDGRRVVSTFGRTSRLYVHDLAGRSLARRKRTSYKGRGGVFNAVVLGDTDRLVATAAMSKRASVLELTEKRGRKLPRRGGVVGHMAALGDRRAVMTDDDGLTQIWNVETRQLERAWTSHADGLWDMSASMNGRWLATVGDDQLVRVWDLEQPGAGL